ncbi:MAG: DUF3426 domain-containing protein [Gammaproteobacteria bacterium]
MYTRCPECRTPFRITRAQLTARGGLVRCGKCQAVFSGPEHLLWFAPAAETPADKTPAATEAKRRTRRKNRGARADDGNDPAIPTISELPWARPRRRLHPLAWSAINIALLAGLLGQGLYFYRNEVARHAALQPLVAEYCFWLGCDIDTAEPWVAPELGPTTIAPHPRFANALRLRAVLVNRTDAPTLHPRMEIALTDSTGRVLARRIFQPRDYLEAPTPKMHPNVAVPALVDLTNPDGKAVGYEIQLLPPRETPPK